MIEFQNVWFAYEKENWVLKGLSFTLPLNQTLAVVGTTGAGKTTITNLLLRFYQPQKGVIKVNGVDIREYTLKELRTFFSTVLQDPVIFSASLAENISLGQENITQTTIEAAIDYVNLRGFVERFPEGIAHLLQERGGGISAGEMQLIALARAVANHRQILILDEATANIDVTTEKLIQNALEKVLKNRTSLVIAHRLTTIQHAHQILVLHHGIVVEKGTHSELVALKGIYEKLYRLQFHDPV